MATIQIPRLLLPKPRFDYQRWAVIACDQFTSQKDYWQRLDAVCGDISTLRLIVPEYYLGVSSEQEIAKRIDAVHAKMEEYCSKDIFDEVDDFVLVERTLPTGGVRVGLMVSIDLEEYDYHLGNKAHIRATEATVESRLPIRVRIRDGARLELSHALALVDDSAEGILEQLYVTRDALPLLYDVELLQGGGHLRGWRVTDSQAVLARLEALTDGRQFRYAVGDGNHSIASAKAYWLQIKEGLSAEQAATHPARYCTCELVNLNSAGLTFHPIHRVVYDVCFDDLFSALKSRFAGEGSLTLIYNGEQYSVPCDTDATTVIQEMAAFLADYCAADPKAKVDYIHGIEHLKTVAKSTAGVGIVMPSMPKSALFPYVEANGILPKKAFSLGEAEEKRYYMECKAIR